MTSDIHEIKSILREHGLHERRCASRCDCSLSEDAGVVTHPTVIRRALADRIQMAAGFTTYELEPEVIEPPSAVVVIKYWEPDRWLFVVAVLLGTELACLEAALDYADPKGSFIQALQAPALPHGGLVTIRRAEPRPWHYQSQTIYGAELTVEVRT